ncbi:MAG: N-acetyltransferase [Planctomycetes bacterium]|nr:N-acetyltransferase [Planctomycetota bacterium]
MSGSHTVDPVVPLHDPARFLDVQRAFYAGDPHYVPPVTCLDRWQVDPEKNPFFRHAEARFLVARRSGEVVGRISAVRNRLHDEFHGDRVGFFGHFEARDEPAARALLEAAAEWLRAHDATELRGPVDLSTNYRCGLLVEGEPGLPVLMMPHNPPRYAAHLLACGLRPAKDLLAFELRSGTLDHARLARVAERVKARTRATTRAITRADLRDGGAMLWSLYQQIWERNWGFAPMAQDEFARHVAEMRAILRPELTRLASIDGTPVGFLIALPDLNPAIRQCAGRLLPLGWWTLLRGARRAHTLRTLLFGVRREHRLSGLDGLMLQEMIASGEAAGFDRCEASWVLEDNVAMIRPLEALGGRVYRRYRIYTRPLSR